MIDLIFFYCYYTYKLLVHLLELLITFFLLFNCKSNICQVGWKIFKMYAHLAQRRGRPFDFNSDE